MHDLTDDEQKKVLGELLFDKLQAIEDGIANLPTRTEFEELKDDIDNLRADVKIIKAVVTDHEKEIRNIKKHPKLKMA